MVKNNPLISIITLNYNGEEFLEDYCSSLKKQIYKNFEVIFVDNGSSDGSIKFIQKNCPNLVLIKNKVNYAIAKGNNIGANKAKGEYILLLNNDVKFGQNYLLEILEGFNKLPQASILQTKIVLMDNPNILDSCGQFWTDMGFVYHYGNQKNAALKKYNTPMKVFAGKSASMVLKREVLERCGMYDDNYWGYYEETDHCHRAWIAGLETWYWPKAEVLHKFGGTTLLFENDFKQFNNFKNKFSSFIVNFEIWYLIYLLPFFLIQNMVISFGWLLTGKRKNTYALYRAIWWDLNHFAHILKRRREVQQTRKLSDKQIFKLVKVNPRLSYYYYLFTTDLSKYQDVNLLRN
jgi:GT2 family glycosyltransferase